VTLDNSIIIAVADSRWSVEFHPACEAWAERLDPPDSEALIAAIRVLRDYGPMLGRPLVDTIKSSRHNNMKELRPGSTGRTEIRLLFAFDLERRAILLVGGDKSDNWAGWYEKNVSIADQRFDEHQAGLGMKRPKKSGKKPSKSQTTKGGKRR
jgi:hypothetical protein